MNHHDPKDLDAFVAQEQHWRESGLHAELTQALQAQIPEHAPGTMTARVLANVATLRWQAERRHRRALLTVFLVFACSLFIWIAVVAADVGLSASLVAGLAGLLVALSYAWSRWLLLRGRWKIDLER